MNIDEIIRNRNRLDRELVVALSTMERKDTISKIRLDILRNQRACPHFDNKYNWVAIDGICPYCGFKLSN